MATDLYKPYTTVAKVKHECKQKQSETGNDDWFKECINDASRMIEEMVRRDFWFHDHSVTPLTVKTGWVVGNEIFLPWPVKTLTVITVDGVEVSTDDWTYENQDIAKGGARIFRVGTVSWAGYNLIEEGDGVSSKFTEGPSQADTRIFGLDRGPSTFDPTQRTIALTGTFGYTLADEDATDAMPTDMPAGVTRACTIIAGVLTGFNRKEVMDSDGAIQEFTEYRVPAEAKKLLKNYRRLVL